MANDRKGRTNCRRGLSADYADSMDATTAGVQTTGYCKLQIGNCKLAAKPRRALTSVRSASILTPKRTVPDDPGLITRPLDH